MNEDLKTGNVSGHSYDVPRDLPVLPVRDLVVYPGAIIPLMVGREKSLAGIQAAKDAEKFLLIVSQKDPGKEQISSRDLYRVGTLARILQQIQLPGNMVKIIVETLQRIKIERFLPNKYYFLARIRPFPEEDIAFQLSGEEITDVLSLFREYITNHPDYPEEMVEHAAGLPNPAQLMDFIALHLDSNLSQKQELLQTASYPQRFALLLRLLKESVGFQRMRKQLDQEVRENMMRSQREYYLQEQMRVIRKELGEEEQTSSDLKKLEEQIRDAHLPAHAARKAQEEFEKLKKIPPFSPEYTVIRNYLDWLVQLPWNSRTRDRIDVNEAQRILDADHFGLEKPKERILEHLAILQRVRKIRGPILCLVGPPGVGKTSLGRSIARALGRKFVRVSLGGVRDEAEIRGHRRTYIGSMPGKIIQSLKKAGSKNPVFLMDEVDKMSADFRGDPSSALLEVLDPEQNRAFSDHYLDVDFDLSEVFFITTANTQSEIPLPLQDRMEIIEIPGYLEHEKLEIARRHLLPKQLAAHGLSEENFSISDDAIFRIIREYTREAGVRNLERHLAGLCRKITRKIVENEKFSGVRIDAADLDEYLGKPPFLFRKVLKEDQVGVATGLAWTPYGGDVLKIEVNIFPGKGKLILTGKLGEVMKESAQTALSYLRSLADQMDIDIAVFQENDIHIHVPEGAIPKDGPSAGVTLATAMLSAFTHRKVRGNIAMTGEITLRGHVLAIGGLNEKMLAAQRNSIPTVIVPAENKKEVDDLPEELKTGVRIIQVTEYSEILNLIFAPSDSPPTAGAREGGIYPMDNV